MASEFFFGGAAAHSEKARQELEEYCDRLKFSLLSLYDAGHSLSLHIENDFQEEGAGPIFDARYIGQATTLAVVRTGRPALQRGAGQTEMKSLLRAPSLFGAYKCAVDWAVGFDVEAVRVYVKDGLDYEAAAQLSSALNLLVKGSSL